MYWLGTVKLWKTISHGFEIWMNMKDRNCAVYTYKHIFLNKFISSYNCLLCYNIKYMWDCINVGFTGPHAVVFKIMNYINFYQKIYLKITMQRLSKLLSLLSTIFLFVVFLMFINLSVIQTHKQTGINVIISKVQGYPQRMSLQRRLLNFTANQHVQALIKISIRNFSNYSLI